MPFTSRSRSWSNTLLLCLIAALFVYEVNLSIHHSIYLWDESIYANNSLEMERGRQYLVYTVDGVADHHNTKPPLVLWLQTISYKIWGYGEFAVRFPSYLALLGTLALCLFYARKLTGSLSPGITACLVILLTPGLIRTHVFLSGDLDALLVFWCAFIFFHHLRVISRPEVNTADIYRYAFLFIAGFLTKSTAILLILPSLALSLLWSGHMRSLLRNRATYGAVFMFILAVAGYYSIRELYDPGYWQIVWYSEFTRVAVNIQPWLVYPAELYFVFLWEHYFRYPLILLVLAGPVYLLVPSLPHKKLFLHSLLFSLAYLGMITIAPVKLTWYDAPAYPPLAFGIGLAGTGLAAFFLARIADTRLRESIRLLTVTGLAAVAFVPLRATVAGDTGSYSQEEESAYALRTLAAAHGLPHVRVLEGNNEQRFIHALDALRFYQKTLRINQGTEVRISAFANEVRPPETVIVCQQARLDSLASMFSVRVLDTCKRCKLIRVQ